MFCVQSSGGSRISCVLGGGGAVGSNSQSEITFQFFAENCVGMKEFGPRRGVRPWCPPPWIRQCRVSCFVRKLLALLNFSSPPEQYCDGETDCRKEY